MTDLNKIDQLVAFALAIAAQQDEYGGAELGPIHLLKYLYLADLGYAESHEGDSFTGTAWKFHHYGPWSVPAFQRLQPAAIAAGAEERTFPTQFDKDAIRWSLTGLRGEGEDENELQVLLASLEAALPREVKTPIRTAIRKFGTDTAALLDFVYKTRPMLGAAPEEALDLKLVVRARTEVSTSTEPKRTEKQAKRRREELTRVVAALKARLAEYRNAPKKARPPEPAPVYDDEFIEGMKALDALAGPPVEPGRGEITVSESVWKSPSRSEPDGD